jgi:hypothetical protein
VVHGARNVNMRRAQVPAGLSPRDIYDVRQRPAGSVKVLE